LAAHPWLPPTRRNWTRCGLHCRLTRWTVRLVSAHTTHEATIRWSP